jgi:hypothetical protein
MKNVILLLLIFVSTTAFFGKGKRFMLECESEKFGKFQWHYDKKNVYEMYPDQPRVYKIDSKFGSKISASSKSSAGMFYAIIDISRMIVSVQGPYGNYTNSNCRRLN